MYVSILTSISIKINYKVYKNLRFYQFCTITQPLFHKFLCWYINFELKNRIKRRTRWPVKDRSVISVRQDNKKSLIDKDVLWNTNDLWDYNINNNKKKLQRCNIYVNRRRVPTIYYQVLNVANNRKFCNYQRSTRTRTKNRTNDCYTYTYFII